MTSGPRRCAACKKRPRMTGRFFCVECSAGFAKLWTSQPMTVPFTALLASDPDQCEENLPPDGPVCPRCGYRRRPSGANGGSWVHVPPTERTS